ncbi:uncharacterized protein BDZ99DRAFT_460624 [Mytilinidion resinicola]|uniref:Uncharacterized protein n=1 Tax=Mytilinidion resinicola TaxID=574789 RepID=A0A6A6YY61_9PEZI|nr:uncharacterized protein BDZ99DRAFT_460624 [Mytilinidion resinicola]KAF2813373.1 hypothetical protein BDZ99DRAFT_460624 [Mytilinidion resinicola]
MGRGGERPMRPSRDGTNMREDDSRTQQTSREETPETTTTTSSSTPATVTNNYNIFISDPNSDQLSDILRRMNIDPSTIPSNTPRATTPTGPTIHELP